MKDIHWLDSTWNVISQQLEVDKIYLETHRDLLVVEDATLEQAKKFFHDRGIVRGSPMRIFTLRTAGSRRRRDAFSGCALHLRIRGIIGTSNIIW